MRLQAKKSGAGGGKKYWSQSAWDQGVRDAENGGGLRFLNPAGKVSKESQSSSPDKAESKEETGTKTTSDANEERKVAGKEGDT